MTVQPEAPLELDESAMFGDDVDLEEEEEGALDMSLHGPSAGLASALGSGAAQLDSHSDASDSDDDGIVLESECSSSGGCWAGRGRRAAAACPVAISHVARPTAACGGCRCAPR